MAPLPPLKTELLPSARFLSPMGGVKLAGTIRGSRGVGQAKMRVLGSHALLYLLEGEGEYGDARGTRQRVRQGDLIWLFPELAHFYGPAAGGRWDEIYFLFEGPLFDLWRRRKIVTPEKPVWRLEPAAFWAARLREMARPPEAAGWEGAFRQLSRWQALVAEMLLALRKSEEAASGSAWLGQARLQLEREGRPETLDEIARGLGLSYETFRKTFTRKMGMAPARYRQARAVERACALLMRPALSHREIAERLGFCDEFHFSKVFRQQMGFPPRLFRAQALAK